MASNSSCCLFLLNMLRWRWRYSKSVRIHFAPGSNRAEFSSRIFIEILSKLHDCGTRLMLLNAGKKLKEACAALAVPARFTCHCYPTSPINLACSKKETAAA